MIEPFQAAGLIQMRGFGAREEIRSSSTTSRTRSNRRPGTRYPYPSPNQSHHHASETPASTKLRWSQPSCAPPSELLLLVLKLPKRKSPPRRCPGDEPEVLRRVPPALSGRVGVWGSARWQRTSGLGNRPRTEVDARGLGGSLDLLAGGGVVPQRFSGLDATFNGTNSPILTSARLRSSSSWM